MSGPIESAAASWLDDPPFTKVFKHTYDVIKEYVMYSLIALGALTLSVRLLTTTGQGEVQCVMRGLINVTSWNNEIAFPGGAVYAVTDFAAYNKVCVTNAMTLFMQYLPFMMLMQTVIIILIEKFPAKLQKISGKMERFYLTLVEESLFGIDPDIAEDICDLKANTNILSRNRQKREVCNALKTSNSIHLIYLAKNLVQIMLYIGFIVLNIYFCKASEKNLHPSFCRLNFLKDDRVHLNSGELLYQCEAKRIVFYLNITYLYVVLQIINFLGCVGAVYWYFCGRSITQLLKSIKLDYPETFSESYDENEGKDFIFLFDLLSHTTGIEATLRVLSHSDETFQKLCKPRIKTTEKKFLQVTEDKLKVVWQAAQIEKWLNNNIPKVMVDSYNVTIFPAETSKNTITKRAKKEEELVNDDYYSALFVDLNGGKTEYIVTITCIIGKSRLKGERIITTLIPYGPEYLPTGMIKTCTTTDIEIVWGPPKGDFTKYLMTVDPSLPAFSKAKKASTNMLSSVSSMSNMSIFSSFSTNLSNLGSDNDQASLFNNFTLSKDSWKKEIGCKETSFTVDGLNPGEPYFIMLKTITADNETLFPLREIALTEPDPVQNLGIFHITTSNAEVRWIAPSGNSCLRAFVLHCSSMDKKIQKVFDIQILNSQKIYLFALEQLIPATEFLISVASVCFFEQRKTVSQLEKVQFITKPLPPANLTLENQDCYSLTVSWDPHSHLNDNAKYKLSIKAHDIQFGSTYEILGDRNTFTFTKFPDIIGAGEVYTIQVILSLIPEGSEVEVDSDPLVGYFMTKPLPPTNLKVWPSENKITWNTSATVKVREYKISYSCGDGSLSTVETVLKCQDGSNMCTFVFQEELVLNQAYVVSISSLVEFNMAVVESKELKAKIMRTEEGLNFYTEFDEARSETSSIFSRTSFRRVSVNSKDREKPRRISERKRLNSITALPEESNSINSRSQTYTVVAEESNLSGSRSHSNSAGSQSPPYHRSTTN